MERGADRGKYLSVEKVCHRWIWSSSSIKCQPGASRVPLFAPGTDFYARQMLRRIFEFKTMRQHGFDIAR